MNHSSLLLDYEKSFTRLEKSMGINSNSPVILVEIISHIFEQSISIQQVFDDYDIHEMKESTTNLFEDYINSQLNHPFSKLISITKNFKDYFQNENEISYGNQQSMELLINQMISLQVAVDEDEWKDNENQYQELKSILSNLLSSLVQFSWNNNDSFHDYEEMYGKQHLDSLNLKTRVMESIQTNMKGFMEIIEDLNVRDCYLFIFFTENIHKVSSNGRQRIENQE
jgi:protein subunit release factor A